MVEFVITATVVASSNTLWTATALASMAVIALVMSVGMTILVGNKNMCRFIRVPFVSHKIRSKMNFVMDIPSWTLYAS